MSDSSQDVFLKIKKETKVFSKQVVLLKDLANIVAPTEIKSRLEDIEIRKITEQPEHSVIISNLEIIKSIKDVFPKVNINNLGSSDIVVDVITDGNKKNKSSLISNTNPSRIFVFLVGFILFIGSGMAIMHFHADVSINKVHQEVYRLIMGQETRQPLLLQIPYSLGVGCGMIIFFNNLLKYKFDSDPSPLEIEMFLYEDKINQYALAQNNTKKTAKEDDSTS